MADHYILAGATGTGSSWSNALGSLPDTLARGDTYWIGDGNYDGYTFNDANNGSSYITVKKATESAHGSNDGWQSTFGDGTATFNAITIQTGYLNFDGVTGGGVGQWTSGFGFIIAASGAGSINVINFNGTSSNMKYVNISHVNAYHINANNAGDGTISDVGGGDVIRLTLGGSNIAIDKCWLHHGPRTIAYPITVSNLTIKNSRLDHNGVYTKVRKSDGTLATQHSEIMSIRGCTNLDIHNCYIYYARSTGGLIVGATLSGVRTNGFKIYNNIFRHLTTDENGMLGGWGSGLNNAINGQIYGNIFIDLPFKAGVNPIGNWTSPNVVRNNIWYDCSGITFGKGVQHNYNVFESGKYPGGEANAQIITASPFINYAGGDYRPKAPTNNGISLPSPFNVDIAGTARGVDGVWDRGIYEYVSGVVAPIIIHRSPASGATGVPTNSNITVTFSEAMDATTINTTNITLANGGSVAGTVSYDSATHIATFDPTANLANSTLYTFTITTGVKNAGGVNMAAQEQWTFTTAAATDVTPPELSGTKVPASGATGVDINTIVTAEFSEALDPTSVNTTTCKLMKGTTQISATVSYNNSTFVVTITPLAPLDYNTVYTPTFTTGIKDVASNTMAAQQTWNFTTIAATVLSDNRSRIEFPNNPNGSWDWSDSASLLIGWGYLYIAPTEAPAPEGTYATLMGQDGSIYRIKEIKTGLWMIVT